VYIFLSVLIKSMENFCWFSFVRLTVCWCRKGVGVMCAFQEGDRVGKVDFDNEE